MKLIWFFLSTSDILLAANNYNGSNDIDSVETQANAVVRLVLDSIVELEKRGETNPAVPANLERLESFFGKNEMMMRNFIYPCDISEAQRDAAAKELYMKYGIFADKDTANAFAVVKENCSEVFDEDGAFIFTAYNHPSLSSDYCRHVIGEAPEMPEEIKETFAIHHR